VGRWLRGRATLLLALLAVALLAGCSGSDAGTPGPAPEEAAPGSVLGVVVTPAIVPLPGVAVRLEPAGLAAVSDDEGRFAFTGLRDGSYTLQAAHPGYLPATLAVETGASVVKVVLEPDRLVGSYVEAYVFDGFIDQSFNVAGARSSGGLSPNYTIGVRAPDLIQMEMVWESTQAFGERLDLTAIANDGNVTLPVAGRAEGTSPLLLAINASAIAEYRLGPDVFLDMAVFSGQEPLAADRGFGLVVSQSYRLVTHMFYGYLPPEGWRFTADGEPPGPA
jgi:hypothetical protein